MSATNKSLHILNATLAPVIIFFAPQNREVIHQKRELIHKLHLACQRFLIHCRAANRDELRIFLRLLALRGMPLASMAR
jgi:hypothetical protein